MLFILFFAVVFVFIDVEPFEGYLVTHKKEQNPYRTTRNIQVLLINTVY